MVTRRTLCLNTISGLALIAALSAFTERDWGQDFNPITVQAPALQDRAPKLSKESSIAPGGIAYSKPNGSRIARFRTHGFWPQKGSPRERAERIRRKQ